MPVDPEAIRAGDSREVRGLKETIADLRKAEGAALYVDGTVYNLLIDNTTLTSTLDHEPMCEVKLPSSDMPKKFGFRITGISGHLEVFNCEAAGWERIYPVQPVPHSIKLTGDHEVGFVAGFTPNDYDCEVWLDETGYGCDRVKGQPKPFTFTLGK